MASCSNDAVIFEVSGRSHEDLKPLSLPLNDLAVILENLHKTLLPLLNAREKCEKAGALTVGLVGVEESCVALVLRSNAPKELKAVWSDVGNAVKTGNWTDLPAESVQGICKLSQYARDTNRKLAFRLNGTASSKAFIPTDTESFEGPRPASIKGATTLYGQLEDVGGASPRIVLRMGDGRRLISRVKQELAKAVSAQLYEFVALTGIATWDAASWAIEDFEVENIEPYKDVGPKKGFDILRKSVGDAWDHIDDVDGAIMFLRGEKD